MLSLNPGFEKTKKVSVLSKLMCVHVYIHFVFWDGILQWIYILWITEYLYQAQAKKHFSTLAECPPAKHKNVKTKRSKKKY